MCGIAGIFDMEGKKHPQLERHLRAMNKLQAHRGPDGEGLWTHPNKHVGFAHRRLSIIDLKTGNQPMSDEAGNWITYNGEIYNYIELRRQLGPEQFKTTSDTEVILAAYRKWGEDCVSHLRGMFAFAIWDEIKGKLFCARDRFGIKPICYMVIDGAFYFASEAKALLPFLGKIETNLEAFKEYITFQFYLSGKTLFKGIHELLPGHAISISGASPEIKRYWQVHYDLDFHHTAAYFEEKVQSLLNESLELHLRSDVPVGAYLSGGIDSSLVLSLASRRSNEKVSAFNGRFSAGPEYDESKYAREVASFTDCELHEIEITASDFIENLRKLIYHLDYPVAGPGSFPQYMVSQFASRHKKVLLGGLGGDEIFGGYVRYLIAYFEQCIKGAIENTLHSGNFIVTYESIIPNLVALKDYAPLLQEFWREGLFEDLDRRYFRLINRATTFNNEINMELLKGFSPFETFQGIFHADNVRKESYFDSMTHFDFKTLLPALLQVEDRVSMAHGLESRVPLLDHPLVEFAATMPSNVKFKNGTMKHVLRQAAKSSLPEVIINRQDKMGFPVPLTQWVNGEAKEFVRDIFSSRKALSRELVNNKVVLDNLDKEPKFGRKIWALLSFELWQQEFHDKEYEFKKSIS
jgi:asparagine synthase (glutamine-hydrolysing)